jgi:hypothetical protein
MKEGKRIPKNPQESLEGSLGRRENTLGSPELTWRRNREEGSKGCGSPLLYPGARPAGYIRSGVGYIQPEPDISDDF